MTPRSSSASRLLAALRGSAVMASMACAAYTAASVAHARQLPPFEAAWTAVIEDGRIEAQAVSVHRFSSRLPSSSILEQVSKAWAAGEGAPQIAVRDGGWRALSTYHDGRYRTLQVKPLVQGGSEGLYSVWSVAPVLAPRAFAPESLLPASAVVLRRFGALDGTRRTNTVVAAAQASPRALFTGLDRRLEALGFVPDPVPRADASGGLRLYRRRGQEIAVTLAPHGQRTAVVVHFTEESP